MKNVYEKDDEVAKILSDLFANLSFLVFLVVHFCVRGGGQMLKLSLITIKDLLS
jgi:hypothetical protein